MSESLIPSERIEKSILLIRGRKVMLDSDLADLYEVSTKNLVKAVKRNFDRFPSDFMFQLTDQEVTRLRFQFGTSSGHGGRRYNPYVFTEQGVAMLASVLTSKRATYVNIEIMRAFVRLRELISSHTTLAKKIAELEKRYDHQFKVVFDAMRELMSPPTPRTKKIGFQLGKEEE